MNRPSTLIVPRRVKSNLAPSLAVTTHSAPADETARQLSNQLEPNAAKAVPALANGRQEGIPLGIRILSAFQILGAIGLFWRLTSMVDQIDPSRSESILSLQLSFLAASVVAIAAAIAGAIGMWLAGKWAWWLALANFAYVTVRGAAAILSDAPSAHFSVEVLRTVLGCFVVIYLFKRNVREYFGFGVSTKAGAGLAGSRLRTGDSVAGVQATAHIAAFELYKTYRKGPIEIPVLAGVDLEVRSGEFLAIVGQSGSGKSTLLHLLATLDAPTSGEVHLNGQRIDNTPAAFREWLRNEKFGMIFQFYHLLPELNVLENTLVPLMIGRGTMNYWRNRSQCVARAKELLEIVGLSHRLKHRPRELSGGEMQRVAIARALIASPQVLLADEPTGNLDQETGREILRILRTLNRDRGLSIVMVTHDTAIAGQADRTVRLVNGRVELAA